MDCCFWVSVCASVSNMGIKKIRSSAEVTLNKSGEVHKSNVDPKNKYSLPSGLWWEKNIFSIIFIIPTQKCSIRLELS